MRTRAKTRARQIGAITALVIVTGIGIGCHRGKPSRPDAPEDAAGPIVNGTDLRSLPPGVEQATIQKLDRDTAAGNALLEVTFERQDPPLPKRLRIFPDDAGLVLRDDGAAGDVKADDGVFSAVTRFDFEELRRQPAILEKQMQAKPALVFHGREAIGVVDPVSTREQLGRLNKLRDVDAVFRDKLKIDLRDLASIVNVLDVDPARSLMVTDPTVVRDPTRTIDPCTDSGAANGVWTFKHLVTEMTAGTGVDPADFVEQWLRLWTTPQTVASGFMAPPRTQILAKVLTPWPRKANGKLDLDKSPFRLSAIVNRIDLGQNLVYGGGNAGEGRFVFGVRDRAGGGCTFMPFSVIFEYGVPKKSCFGVKAWAQQWVDLNQHPIGSPQYRAALEAITETFAKAGAAPGKPNGSALNQLRTNENALVITWELREFRLNAATHLLFEDTVKQTPSQTLNGQPIIAQYVNDPTNTAKIKADAHVVPNHYPLGTTNPFMGASSLAASNQFQTHFAAAGITDNDARFHFSLNTCTACHIRETGTNATPAGNTAFLHVDPQAMPARLSRFLTGTTPALDDNAPFVVNDPVVPATTHAFNDLDNRRTKLAEFAGASCLKRILIGPRRLFRDIPHVGPDDRLPPISDLRALTVNDPVRFTH